MEAKPWHKNKAEKLLGENVTNDLSACCKALFILGMGGKVDQLVN